MNKLSLDKSKVMVQWTGEGTEFRILNGTHLGEIVDEDDIQWDCPKCGAKWNDAGDDCEKCGEDSPYEIVPPTGDTLRQPTKPNYGRDVKHMMHQMKKSPGAPKLSSEPMQNNPNVYSDTVENFVDYLVNKLGLNDTALADDYGSLGHIVEKYFKTPEQRKLFERIAIELQKVDFLGFDYMSQAISAIAHYSDWKVRWDTGSNEILKTLGDQLRTIIKIPQTPLDNTPKLSSVLDSIADRLEAKGLIKEAYEIDKAADILEKTTQKK